MDYLNYGITRLDWHERMRFLSFSAIISRKPKNPSTFRFRISEYHHQFGRYSLVFSFEQPWWLDLDREYQLLDYVEEMIKNEWF
jgi:hypothetical protein